LVTIYEYKSCHAKPVAGPVHATKFESKQTPPSSPKKNPKPQKQNLSVTGIAEISSAETIQIKKYQFK